MLTVVVAQLEQVPDRKTGVLKAKCTSVLPRAGVRFNFHPESGALPPAGLYVIAGAHEAGLFTDPQGKVHLWQTVTGRARGTSLAEAEKVWTAVQPKI